jgi:Uma2 family endonuclease
MWRKPMAVVTTKLLSAAEFARLPNPPDGSRQELVRGEIVTMPPPGFRHGVNQLSAAVVIQAFVKSKGLGQVTVNSGTLTEREPDTVRGPDIAFWHKDDLPLDQQPTGYPDVAPRLCVEILSPSNRMAKIVEKIGEYFTSGVKMVWVIDPEDLTVAVYRRPQEARLFHESATISGEDVLPGFSCTARELLS